MRGETRYTLDDKGRVVIPPRFRLEIGDRVIVTRWIDPCLAAFSPAVWQSVDEKLRAQPLANRDFVRLLSAAEPCDLDRQGRITLTPQLREFASIARDVTIVGVGNHLEIWSSQKWRRRIQTTLQNKEIAQQVGSLVLG
ncbi:MAG TPA: division/cell wall cluster transcriptional repressor MraZ [bacterium]|nr:division/cell wall cluster transcriptional repressor MraZ [bacterium]